MKKKCLALALALVLCLGLLPVTTSAADGDFEIKDGVLVKCQSNDKNVTIPSGVTEIGDRSFWGCDNMTSVTIPDGVTKIGVSPFAGCKSLESIKFPNSLKTIGFCAFRSCKALTSIDIPEGVQTIEGAAFAVCDSLTSVTIPGSVQTIGGDFHMGGAFSCLNLKSVKLSKGLKTIEDFAFSGCISLTSIDIPDGVQTIGGCAFRGCKSLKEVTIPSSVRVVGNEDSIGGSFQGCTSLTSVTISNGVQHLAYRAFCGCDKLTDIIVPPSVKEIGEEAIGYRDILLDKKPYDYGHVTIHGQAGSAAETYAKENNIKFVADWNGGTTEPTPTPEIDPVKKFTDVNAGDWFVNAVKYVLNKNLFKGTSGKTFEPNTTTNRAMFVVVLARGDGADQKGDKIWYDRDVQWAVAQGYYDGKDPEGGIPRQEMALILYRRAGSPKVSGDLSKYSDASGVSGEMKDALVWAVQTGYLKGVGGGRLNPQGTATRAEVATIFMRVFG